MPLNIQQIYQQYSVRSFYRNIQIKRRFQNGTYETNWQDVSTLARTNFLENSVGQISYNLPNNSYNYGIVEVGNITFLFDSKESQFDAEDNPRSIFFGYKRNGSLIRVLDGYFDPTVNPQTPVTQEVFYGFINDASSSTKVDNDNLLQNILGVDVLGYLLDFYSISNFTLTNNQTLNNLIFQILNRPEFTAFFSVNLANITAGFNISQVDLSVYEPDTTLYELFQNLSQGHSFFYVKNGVFFYKSILAGNANTLVLDRTKILEFSDYQNGIEKVFEKVYWESQENSIFYINPINIYNKSLRFQIRGATQTVDRSGLVEYVGKRTSLLRKSFIVNIPYYMNLNLLDTIQVIKPEITSGNPLTGFWDVGVWDVNVWDETFEADNIPDGATWLIREIRHSNDITSLRLEEIVPLNI